MNGNGAKTMLDTGSIHNFVANCMVQQLGLKVSKSPSKIKTMNFEAKTISGIAFGMKFKVGEQTGNANFLIMQLNDVNVILGNEFFVEAKAALLPFIRAMLIFYETQPCYVLARRMSGNRKISKGKIRWFQPCN